MISTGHIECSHVGSAVVQPDGTRDVISWRFGEIHLPAVHRVRATLIRFPVGYYQHADYGPEVMAARPADIARLGWCQHSFHLPYPPETIGHFNLASEAVATAYETLSEGRRTKVSIGHPASFDMRGHEGYDWFRVYLNVSGLEFYHLLFEAGKGRPSIICDAPGADVGTVPKLLAWLRPFETAKRKLYKSHGFDWNPRRGPIELGPTKGDL